MMCKSFRHEAQLIVLDLCFTCVIYFNPISVNSQYSVNYIR